RGAREQRRTGDAEVVEQRPQLVGGVPPVAVATGSVVPGEETDQRRSGWDYHVFRLGDPARTLRAPRSIAEPARAQARPVALGAGEELGVRHSQGVGPPSRGSCYAFSARRIRIPTSW